VLFSLLGLRNWNKAELAIGSVFGIRRTWPGLHGLRFTSTFRPIRANRRFQPSRRKPFLPPRVRDWRTKGDAVPCPVARTRFPLHSSAFGVIHVLRGDYRKEQT